MPLVFLLDATEPRAAYYMKSIIATNKFSDTLYHIAEPSVPIFHLKKWKMKLQCNDLAMCWGNFLS